MKAAFVGIGGMGRGMAANLVASNLLTTVFNRTTSRAEQFAEAHGVMVSATPAEAARQAEVVAMCVSADDDVLEMIDAMMEELTSVHLIIDCSTVASDTAQEAARRVAEAGAGFIDAPVSGGPEGADEGTLSIMVGASEEALKRARPVLDAMGSRVTHMGPVGAGQATKAVNQIMVAGINQAVCEALNFARAQGLPMDSVVDVVGNGAAGNWLVNKRGKTMTRDVFEPGFKLKHHHKDLGISLHMGAQCGAPAPLAEKTRQEYAQLLESGHGEEDISALYRLWNNA